jgi:magnesium transporter
LQQHDESYTLDVPLAQERETAADVRTRLAGQRFETLAAVAVCREGTLLGLVRLEELFAAPPTATMDSLIDTAPAILHRGQEEHIEQAAWRAVQQGEATVAVVDEAGRFAGLLSPRQLLRVLLAEHEEDMARLGGFLRGASRARQSSEEPIVRRYWHRLPWLMVGLGGALLAAEIVGAFGHRLEETLLLAFFIPGIVYMADAVGTQTEALIVRGLSVGVPIRHVVRKEIATGLLIGLSISVAFFPLGLWRWGDVEVVLSVSTALFASCTTATVVAMALPWALHRAGLDPAFGSGPLATVIQDLLSMLIYLLIAGLLVTS